MKNISKEMITELLDNTPDYVQGWKLPDTTILRNDNMRIGNFEDKNILEDNAIFDAFPDYKRLMIGVINWYGGNWIHIDIDNHTLSKKNAPDFVPLDLCCDAKNLPFENNSIGQICSASMLEHVLHKEIDLYLKEWYRVLYNGSRIDIIVPNIIKIVENCNINENTLEEQEYIFWKIYGGQDFLGDTHRCGFTKFTLKNRLEITGFKNIKEVFYTYENIWLTAIK